MEHTGWSVETIRELIASTNSTAMVPVVRVPATEYHFIARVLDMEFHIDITPSALRLTA